MAYASSGCVLEISSDRDDQRNFLGLDFHFQAFWGYENLASIYISWRLISVNKVQPKKVHVVIYCFLKILRLRNLAWDFFGGVRFGPGIFLGFVGIARDFLGFDFCPCLNIPIT